MLWCKRREKQIQIEDGTYVKPEWRTLKMTKGQIYGAFGGSISGSLVWLFRITVAADDWGIKNHVFVQVFNKAASEKKFHGRSR